MMDHFKVNSRDLFFILKEQLSYGSLCRLDRYKDLNELTFDMLVTEAMGFARGVIATLQVIGEEKQITYRDSSVFCPNEYHKAFRRYGEDGWIAAARNTEYGGLGVKI
jgi:alkylation response protein AidB-like acyl-CoA dehydrogenase